PHDPHVPRVPHPRFAGKSGLGPRGDAIVQLDWSVGEIIATLDRLSLASNTVVIMTSDNGPVIDDGYQDESVARLGKHRPSGPFRGGKYSNFEAGTRIPFVVRWPARVKPGVSDALVAQIDLLRSLAALTGQPLAAGDAPDSSDTLTAFTGASTVGRTSLVLQGSGLSLRVGHWKYIEPSSRQKVNRETNTELGNDSVPQLYDLSSDRGETNNVAGQHPQRVAEMAALLQTLRGSSR
ncbi:MAG TPA: sulfatase-like hydrolase/transferase, partial [Vicinamibacterales bacterium]|nr:sulfatase-like hydrolase/transferase [Vicinamibacterales bacterium]